jgi:hypothetical protein
VSLCAGRATLLFAGIASLAALAADARADGEDPRVLFAAGRYAAAADVFEHRWRASGDALDGVNAVVSWRTAGRYARASALLARVRTAKAPPVGDAATTAAELEQRLATLTAVAVIEPLPAGANVLVDSDPAERIGNDIVLDVGEHDIIIEQEGCDAFTWHDTAYPGARLGVTYRPTCDQRGALHVYVDGDRDRAFTVDGQRRVATGLEADVPVDPGMHRIAMADDERPVYDEPVAVERKRTTPVHVLFPWRARGLGFVLAATSGTRAGQVMTGTGGALTLGLWSSQLHTTVDFGSMISDTPGLQPDSQGPGHPWFGATFAWHVWNRPLWHGRLGPYRLALDFDPLAARWDEVRGVSFFGIRAIDSLETRVRAWSFLPFALSADGPYVHVELTLWPVSYATYHAGNSGDEVGNGWSSFATLLIGRRL